MLSSHWNEEKSLNKAKQRNKASTCLTVTRILEEQNQMSVITFFKKKVASKVLSFLFLLAPFTSKQKKKTKQKMQKDQPLTGRYLDSIEAVR